MGRPTVTDSDLLQFRDDEDYAQLVDTEVHRFRGHRCKTDTRGHPAPHRGPFASLRVGGVTGDVVNTGIIPLWQRNMMLRYRFNGQSMLRMRNPERVMARIRDLFAAAVGLWGDSAPIRFTERSDAPDFEFVVRNADDCDSTGCVLAAAFFPDHGQHSFVVYPEMFRQDENEQVETMAHEIGHIFGLRHFFANVSETDAPAQLFGTDSRFSIMNYGEDSYLTPTDKTDLRTLYEEVWSGRRTDINRTPIRLMTPFSTDRV
jgi:hypothetical protein